MSKRRVLVYKSIKGGRTLWSGTLSAGTSVIVRVSVKDTNKCVGKVCPVIYRVIEYAFWPTERKPVAQYGWLRRGEHAEFETSISEDGKYEIALEADRYAEDCETDIEIIFE